MPFIADLHIHSRFSRATSKQLCIPHLAAWARLKGINVLGTGDFTHPAWREELAQHLMFDEATGLYRLAVRPESLDLPGLDAGRENASALNGNDGPLFCLQTEISSIYKRNGKVRKVHNLVFVPTLEDAERLSARLARIGNLASDGRPILGLDSHDLLEILLETVPGGRFIPAHIWTPWFSLFGSRSGFDDITECFADLSGHIFALETGLSSNPDMNRRVSKLDGFALVSNSDAHSGANLGREANLFAGEPSYEGIFAALATSSKRQPQAGGQCRFLGTLEFFPEEGKYHLDGHRACNVSLDPQEAVANNNICPVCGKPLTIGVLHRVMELADRAEAVALPLEPETHTLVPLAEVVGEILGVGSSSRKAQAKYGELLRELGPELDILCSLPVDGIRRYWEPLGEAVDRLRKGRAILRPGYDGQFGVVRVFSDYELAEIRGGQTLPGMGRRRHSTTGEARPAAMRGETLPLLNPSGKSPVKTTAPNLIPGEPGTFETAFTGEQQAALTAGPEPVLVLAGPGAGKTRVLVGRILHLLETGTQPQAITAVTFTRRAAAEMRGRLTKALAYGARSPQCDTLHALAWHYLSHTLPGARLLNEETALHLFVCANGATASNGGESRKLWQSLELARERREPPITGSGLERAAQRYAAALNEQPQHPCFDYTGLLEWLLANIECLQIHPQHLLVDEIQDLTPLQLAVIQALLPPDGRGFFGIGDPDQSIYAFRGASSETLATLGAAWPTLQVHRLGRSFRASQSVLDMARHLMANKGLCGPLTAAQPIAAQLRLFAATDDNAEARWVAHAVARLLGATSHSLLDQSNKDADQLAGTLSPGDIAILVRIRAQMPALAAALDAAGVPHAVPSEHAFWQDSTCADLLSRIAQACGLRFAAAREASNSTELAWVDDTALPWTGKTMPPPADMLAWLASRHPTGDAFVNSRAYRRLCRYWRDCGSWEAFFEQLAWLNEAELASARAERVQLLTLHASKGLEFRAVFLPGLEDGLLPLNRAMLFGTDGNGGESDLAEERRLLYVGLTRAAQGIFVSHCARRRLYGKRLELAPSRFLPMIRDYCQQSRIVRHRRVTTEQGSLF